MSDATSSPHRPMGRFGELLHLTPTVRKQLSFMTILLALIIGAWAIVIIQAHSMGTSMGIGTGESNGSMENMGQKVMTGMADLEWSLSDGWMFFSSWTVMMAAMMLPSAMPMLLLFARVRNARGAVRSTHLPTWIFGGGYLIVWAMVGLGIYAVILLGSRIAISFSSMGQVELAPIAFGATLVAAGAYQLTPLKRTCLGHCRSPLGYLIEHWHDGQFGAFRMGLHHGVYCLGCCWALFAVMVAAGVMSLGWMIVLSLVVFAEKVFPFGRHTAGGVGVMLILLGILVASQVVGMPWTA